MRISRIYPHCTSAGFLLVAVLLGTVALNSGCEPQNQIQQAQGFIAVVMPHKSEVGQVLLGGAIKGSSTLGGPPVKYFEPDAPTQHSQNALLEKLGKQDLLALLIQVVDPEKAKPVLDQLRSNGIHVVTLLTQIEHDSMPFFHSGPNPFDVGLSMGNTLVKACEENGIIALIVPGKQDSVAHKRYMGFMSIIETYPGINILRKTSNENTPRETRKTIEELCERFPSLTALVTFDTHLLDGYDPSEPPIVPDQCKLLTVGVTPGYWGILKADRCFGLAGPSNYPLCSLTAAQWCVALIRGNTLEQDNYSADVKCLLRKDLDRWKRIWSSWTEKTQAAIEAEKTNNAIKNR